jgi:pyruvate/2-oxoglutarate dehydrogenase complex dihydrolipoamide dehydrogenase (E3) component
MNSWDYDVVVLGGGSAGSSAAAAAAERGARTLMINDGELGGLCILRGCMPTKSMLAAAHVIHEAQHLEPFGARLDGRVEVDFAAIATRKDRHVERFKRAKIESIESQPYELLDARAKFVSSDTVEAGGRQIRARSFVIATGSNAAMLPIPGLESVPVWTSDDVMQLRTPPRRLLVQGAGPIGLELAQFFARVGTEVTLVNRSQLLAKSDAESGQVLHAALDDEPRFDVVVPGTIKTLAPHGDGLIATLVADDGKEQNLEADALLMAVGRSAAIQDLGLDAAGVHTERGSIPHDGGMRTNRPNIWVAGDSTGRYQILHLANEEGRLAGHHAAGGEVREIDYRLKMSVVFTDPPFAQVGMSEDEARGRGIEVVIGRANFPETGRAITMETRHGLWKLIIARDSGEILGSSIIGPRADDLIHVISSMMHFGGKLDDIERMPWYHPTLSEVILNLLRDARSQLT